jgi:hypothetical protein
MNTLMAMGHCAQSHRTRLGNAPGCPNPFPVVALARPADAIIAGSCGGDGHGRRLSAALSGGHRRQ